MFTTIDDYISYKSIHQLEFCETQGKLLNTFKSMELGIISDQIGESFGC